MNKINFKLKSFNLILASGSPRRREIISGLDLEFSGCRPFSVEETFPADMKPEDVAAFLSKKKNEAYPFIMWEKDIIITADTVVIVDDKILGKPKNHDEAKAMLTMLSGKEHKVITGVTMRCGQTWHTFSETTKVVLRDLSEEEIEYYVLKYNPLDKAGSYAIQEWIGYAAIERIEGTFYNVMGFPANVFYRELEALIDRLCEKE